MEKLTENRIRELVKNYLLSDDKGNWHEEKVKEAGLHQHGADLVMTGGKYNGERFIIECKGRSYAKSAVSVNKEGWLNALGQLVTRMDTERVILSGKTKGSINTAYKYGLGLYWEGAQVAIRRIPHEIAKVLNLYVFSVDDEGFVKKWTPGMIGKSFMEEQFHQTPPEDR